MSACICEIPIKSELRAQVARRMTRKQKAKERDDAIAMLEAMAKPDTFWPKLADEIRRTKDRLFYGWGRSAIPGLTTIEATHPDTYCPLGTVWFRWISDNQIDIVYSYVRPGVQKCGIRTYLHEKLLAAYPNARVTTNSGTIAGISWMQKVGYKFNPPGEWVFDRTSCEQTRINAASQSGEQPARRRAARQAPKGRLTKSTRRSTAQR